MLRRLHIENYALIERVTIEFGPGLNVLTGETGSGKSIILDALGLLLGDRADAAAIRAGAAQATVTATFACPILPADRDAWGEARGLAPLGDEVIVRRDVGARGRAFIDNQPVTLAVLRELARELGEIHSQTQAREALATFTPRAQLQLLDRFAAAPLAAAALAANAAFAAWRAAADHLRDLQDRERLRLQQADLWRYQAQELDAARLVPAEDAALEQERLLLANSEKIAAAASAAYECLYDAPQAAAAQLKLAERQLRELLRFDDRLASLAPRLEALRAETADIADQLRETADRAESDPARLAAIEERLQLIERLKRKYAPSVDAMLELRQQLAVDLDQVDNAAAHRAEAGDRAAGAAAEYRRSAALLSKLRRAAAPRLRDRLQSEVADLAMPLRFEVDFGDSPAPGETPDEAQWTPAGWDRVRFFASTNPGEPLQPVSEIASGGELSRLLLALHLVAEDKTAPGPADAARTLVLDEVDAGIGGRAAEAVGAKMRSLGRHFQLLCVTHLASIAACAQRHLSVEKDTAGGRTRTAVLQLEGPAREAEIARMLAGNQARPTALRHARELLLAARAAD